MSRSHLLGASAVLSIASLFLLLGLLVTQGVTARAPTSTLVVSASSAPSAFQPPGEYCYSWDFNNSTGQDATGVHVPLSGIQALTRVYTGTLNPFGDLGPSSGYDSGTDTYRFNFDNGYASDSDRVQLGLCVNQPQLRLSNPVSSAVWLSGTALLAPSPLFAGIEFDWQARDQVTVTVVNEQALTMTLESAVALQPEVLLPLDDRTPDVAMQLPLVAELITEPLTLPPLAAQSFDVQLTALNQPTVFEAQLSREDDPGDVVHLLVQTTVPGWQVCSCPSSCADPSASCGPGKCGPRTQRGLRYFGTFLELSCLHRHVV